MPFQPGQSGNPAGRAPVNKELRDLARQHMPQAIETLAALMSDRLVAPAARIAAANSLLDRGYGKPVQEVTGADGVPLLGDIIIRLVKPEPKPDAEPDAEHGAWS